MSERDDMHTGDDGYVHDEIKEHEFDGIQEFDNKLPNWWLWTLYGSIVFSLLYWIVFHTLEIGTLPEERFAQRMQAAQEAQLERAAKAGLSNATFAVMSGTESRVQQGREVFQKHCTQCHLEQGQGSVGPNLTDGYWIHGCEPMQMYETVKEGVPAKGMPAWMNQLGPDRVQAVVAYVMTLTGTEVDGKAPEGEPCTFDAEAAQAAADDSGAPADADTAGTAPADTDAGSH